MKDRILSAHLEDFRSLFGLKGLSDSEAFEAFANYCVIAQHYPDTFDPTELGVGGGGDLGLDGIGILVNSHLVSTTSDVDHFKEVLRRLDAHFVFVQAKISPSFESAGIGTFLSGIRSFFQETLTGEPNTDVRTKHDIKEHIYRSSIDMEQSPRCTLYYVTTGVWKDEPALIARYEQGLADLRATSLFSEVEFVPVDADYLKRIYRELHHGITRDIVFDKHTIVPPIGAVHEAYIGLVPATEYLKLICDDSGALNRRLFYDNVRDFQGLNPVNKEIADTLEDSAHSDRFALLNNGVTIVARGATKIGAKFNLKNYQIVNGCQTSHMLYMQREHLTASVFVPIKLIVTDDSEVTTQIIQATNRQTEVKLEAFESVLPFQKRLEEYYQAASRDLPLPLYYERRSKQYEHSEVRRDRIISLATQINCFMAMFLNEPHSTHRYYGELLTAYRGRLFSDSHDPIAYFVSGASLASLEHFFAEGLLPRQWRRLKYQMLMTFRLQTEEFELPYLNGRDIGKYCQGVLECLRSNSKCLAALRLAGELVESVNSVTPRGREAPERTRALTSAIIEATKKGHAGASSVRLRGTVKWFSDTRGYGFLTSEDGGDIFVHFSAVLANGYRVLIAGEQVMYSVAHGVKGPYAVDVAVGTGAI